MRGRGWDFSLPFHLGSSPVNSCFMVPLHTGSKQAAGRRPAEAAPNSTSPVLNNNKLSSGHSKQCSTCTSGHQSKHCHTFPAHFSSTKHQGPPLVLQWILTVESGMNTLPEMLSLKLPQTKSKYNMEIIKEGPAVTSPFPGHHQTCTLVRQGSLSSFCQLFLRYGMNSSFFRNACNSYPLITPSSSSETPAVFIGQNLNFGPVWQPTLHA